MGPAQGLFISDECWHFSAQPSQQHSVLTSSSIQAISQHSHKGSHDGPALQRGKPSNREADLSETTVAEWKLNPEILALPFLPRISQQIMHDQRGQELACWARSPHTHSSNDDQKQLKLFLSHITSISHIQGATCYFSQLPGGKSELPGATREQHSHNPLSSTGIALCFSGICASSCWAGGVLSTLAFQAHMHRHEQARRQERKIFWSVNKYMAQMPQFVLVHGTKHQAFQAELFKYPHMCLLACKKPATSTIFFR